MKLITLALLLLVSMTSWALSEVPTITADQLAPGNSWTWSYYEGEQRKFYSTERYTVTEHTSNIVVFEIWTRYANTTEFTPSARLTVDLRNCERAYRGQRRPFSIGMQGMENGKWSSTIYRVRSTGFEEKFNCNPFEYKSTHPLYSTIDAEAETPWGWLPLFQQRPKVPSQILSYYFKDHQVLKGIAYRKAFNADSPYEYAMELVEYSFQAR